MKLQKTIILSIWILTIIILVSCSTFSQNSVTTALPLTATELHLIATALPIVITVTPAPSLSPHPSPSSVITSTIHPLPDEQARARLLELLANNGGCRLPCLWGITPGKSSFQESWAILAPLGGLSGFTDLSPNLADIQPNYIEGDLKMLTSVNLVIDKDKNIVTNINFKALQERVRVENDETRIFDVFNLASFGKRVGPYMLPQILSSQGMPTAVEISTFNSTILRGQIINGGFNIFLLYPDKGLVVGYTTQMHSVGEKVFGCPANAHVKLKLYPSGKGAALAEFLSTTEWAKLWPMPTDSPSLKPIEKATSMTLEQFYETFRQPTDRCIETPAKLWPPTEQ